MLQVNLKKLISKLAYEADEKALTVQYLADETEFHRNTITRLLDDPTANCHTDMLNKLLKLFLAEFKAVRGKGVDEAALANELLREFITVSVPKPKPKRKSSR